MKSEQDKCLSILIVDWNEMNAASLSSMLHMLHFHTDQTGTGQSCIRMMQDKDYDMVIVNHWMPDMSGPMIVKTIRSLTCGNKPLIYVLAPALSSEILQAYREAGANKVFEKPLKLEFFLKDLKLYFPDLYLYMTSRDQDKRMDDYHWNKIRLLFAGVEELNIEAGRKSSLGNHKVFIQIMKSAHYDVEAFLSAMAAYTDVEHNSDFILRLHNLKSVFSYVGADKLLESTKKLEMKGKAGNYDEVKLLLDPYIRELKHFKEQLKRALDDYNDKQELKDVEKEDFAGDDPEEAYEQCIQKTIYYIKRFEYDLILHELNKLIIRNDEHQHLFLKAEEEIRNFNYEGALRWMNQVTCRQEK